MSFLLKRSLLPVFLFVLVPVFTGCAGYRLGGSLPPSIRTIHIATFANKCDEPGLEITATSAAIQGFQQDGTLGVRTAEDADGILNVTLTGFSLKPLSYPGDQISQADEYRLTLTATMELTERKTGKILASRKDVTGQATFQLLGDFAVSKQTAFPIAAQDLARNLVEMVVEYW